MSFAERLQHVPIPLDGRTLPLLARAAGANLCPLCHAHKNRLSFRDNHCSLRMCTNCGLFFVAPYPSTIDQHQQVSSSSHSRINLLDCKRRYEGERLYYERHFASIAQECAGARSLLDVGCGTGHLLERLAAIPDLHRAGLELNPEAAEFARRKSACEVVSTSLEGFRCDHRFDVITMINVFSHIPWFDGMFDSVRDLLSPNGKLILRTTEMSARVSRWNQAHWGIPDDLHFLGLTTLDFICEKYGFAISKRERLPFEDELFRISRWKQMGRSPWQNAIKRSLVHLPGALKTLRNVYAALLGHRLFVSLIVLRPLTADEIE